MTLVPSLQQLLNGNKIIICGLILTLSGCGNLQKTQETTEVVEIVVPESEKEDADIPDQVIDPEIIEEKDIVIEKANYDIALLLPFELDNVPISSNLIPPTEEQFKSSSKIAVEFYQGLVLAIEQLKKSDFKANLYVIDTKNNEKNINHVFTQKPFPKIDLIIGPIFNKELRQAAIYAKSKKIPMISPLSSSTGITKKNPYYYSANASAEVHYERLFNHVKDDFESKTLFVFHQNTEEEQKIIDQFNVLNKQDNSNDGHLKIIPYEMATDQKSHDLKSMLDSTVNSLVLVPSYNESFVEYALNQLAQIAHHFPSTVFGMPKWKEFRNVNFDYLEWMNVQLTTSYCVDSKDKGHLNFMNNFFNKYGYYPSDYSKQAYDLMLYLSKNLSGKYKKGEILLHDADFNGIQTNFNFESMLNSEGEIDFICNKFVHLIEFEDFQFKKIKE